MKHAKHKLGPLAGCPACITMAETNRRPWQSDYLAVLAHNEDEFRKRHDAAIKRRNNENELSYYSE